MSYRITVTKQNAAASEHSVALPAENEVFRQTVEELDLPKFVIALNKQPRVRKARVAKTV